MGILSFFTGKKKIFSYQILFGDESEVSVTVNSEISPLPYIELIDLWGLYVERIINNSGPNSEASFMLLNFLRKINEEKISPKLNFFRLLELDDVIRFSKSINVPRLVFSGDYLGKDESRFIIAKFPYPITEQQVIFSVIALLQFVYEKNIKNVDALEVLSLTIEGTLEAYFPQYDTLGSTGESEKTTLEDGKYFDPKKDILADKLINVVRSLVDQPSLISENLNNYCEEDVWKNYSGLLKIGYCLRLAEENLSRKTLNNDAVGEVAQMLRSKKTNYEKIDEIANYFGTHLMIGLIDNIKPYILLDYDVVRAVLDEIAQPVIDQYTESNEDRDIIEETVYRNISHGYHFRVAENLLDMST